MAQPSEIDYVIEVKTGSGRFRGTDLNVRISLHGDQGDIPDHALLNSETHKDPFESGQKDRFRVKSPYLGYVSQITLRVEKSVRIDSWFVDEVQIQCTNPNGKEEKYSFTFDRWFSVRRGLEHSQVESGFPILSIDPDKDYKERHHVDQFDVPESSNLVILRRGCQIKFKLSLSRPLQSEKDDFTIVLKTGQNPRESNNTLIKVSKVNDLKEVISKNGWGYQILYTEENNVFLGLFVPSDALVARYHLSIQSTNNETFERDGKIIILFNPWCPDDECYMNSEDDLKEYVLNEYGYVYHGTARRPYPREWYFGQFEMISLETAFYLLENRVPIYQRDTAAEVSRLISSKCNSNDNNGILMGNWSGDFSGGEPPSFWSTTPSILQKYRENGNRPVRYGQCWVYAAIVNTIMRTLGIPCRPVSNFSSAHDTDANCTNDVYISDDGEVDESMSTDSVWNFHVWNDAWMTRSDLQNEDYNGWQAIDATPQERSGGLYQMGPSPLYAIKNGQVDTVFDTKFVFAEVNADTVYWRKQNGGDYEPVRRISSRIGQSVSTKQVNSSERHDITDQYKFPDNSVLERESVRTALRLVNNRSVPDVDNSFSVKILAAKDDYHAGEDIVVNVSIKNLSDTSKRLVLILHPKLTRYDGNPVRKLEINGSDRREVSVTANEEFSTSFVIYARNYIRYLQGDDSIRLYASVQDPTNRDFAADSDEVDILKPDLQFLNIADKVRTSEGMTMTISFKNPLNIPLTGCRATIGGLLMKNPLSDFSISDVPANGTFEKTYNFEIKSVNGQHVKRKFLCTFWCRQLGGFSDTLTVTVCD